MNTKKLIMAASAGLIILCSYTYKDANSRPVDKHHFLIHGNVIELSPEDMIENQISGTQIIVYQNDEIYVAFDTDEKGDYEFNLPNGYDYSIHYGTRAFVPKKIDINASEVYEKRDGHSLKLNVAVFKEVENVDYAVMDEPMSKFNFEMGKRSFDIDYEYAEYKLGQMRDLYKTMKKMKKKNFKEKKEINQ